MQLTKGQKDALVRKALAIVEKKKAEKREELIKDYKPSREATELLDRIKKLLDARKKFYKVIEELGFRVNYNYIEPNVKDGFNIEIVFNKNDVKFSELADKIREKELGSMYNNKFKYPTEYDIMDEIELANLSKSFDIDAFLKKYEEL